MNRLLLPSLVVCLALGGAGAVLAQMSIENRDILSPTEREIFHEQMGSAETREEREGYRTGHSDTVRERAGTRGTDMSETGRGMRDGDHGHSADSGQRGDGGAHGTGIGGSGSGHQYGPGSNGSSHGRGQGVSHSKSKGGGQGDDHGKGKKGK